MAPDRRLRRVVVVGATGAGKSVLAERLARSLGLPFVELDALFWGPEWTAAEPAAFRARVAAATAGPAWVVAGNYGAVRDLLWPRADTIVWLDYSFPVVLARLTARTVYRGITRERLWNGNRENLWEHAMVWSEHSLFNWLFRTFWRYRREFPALFRAPAHAHARVVHLRSPRAAREWLAVECAARAMPPLPGADR
ncbi:MAG TPA: adenylate kinase [Methylomirabilota bacterium]